jgi:hypothetical protein
MADRGGITKARHLADDEGVFQLSGYDAPWIWAHTCPTPKCSCRSALILATNDGRAALLERGAPVRTAWQDGSGYADVAARLSDLDVFHIEIDSIEIFTPLGDEPLDLAKHPRIRAIVERLDGELLEEIGRLWYRGKGLPNPESAIRRAGEIVIEGWQPGEMLAWNDVLRGVRQDLYLLDDRVFEATEMYCPVPDCSCGEVIVDFETLMPRGAPPPGRVTVQRAGAVKFESGKDRGGRLARLWAAFEQRFPKYLERFARRYPVMKEVGARVEAKPRPSVSTKVGRNEPCPCGSGKKYKKCCGSASA